jgi:hypothetical protein
MTRAAQGQVFLGRALPNGASFWRCLFASLIIHA